MIVYVQWNLAKKMTTESNDKTLPVAQRIDNERIYLLYKQTPIGSFATVVNGLICAYLLRNLINPKILICWFGLLIAISLVRILLVLHYHRYADSTTWASRYKIWNIFTLGLSGVVWGSSAFLLFPPVSVPHQLLLGIVTIGMVAGATMAFSIYQSAFLAYAVPTLIPIAFRFLTTPLELHFFTGIMAFLLFFMSLLIARNINKARVKYIQLKETLADQVTEQTEALRNANIRLQAEHQKREKFQAQLEETRKFEAIANLAGGIAHQFNNALSVIIGNTELVKLDHKNAPHLKDYLDPINKSAYQMSQLTNQLLAYAKGGKYKPRILNLSEFVRTTLSTIQHTFSQDLSLKTEFEKYLEKVEIDITQMQMVISAIISNASEATNHKGTIRIACRQEILEQPCHNRYGELPAGRYIVLEVSDNGIGMDGDTLQRIFEPFYTTKFQGRGLGMAAVYGIVKNHRGFITVSSKLGQGAKVCIYLPIYKTDHKQVPSLENKQAAPNDSRILLIEDEALVMEINQKLLERLGYSVIKASSGKTAIDLIRQTAPQFDIVLLDIKLPDMDGAAIYPIIRQHRPDTKVVICSGYSLEGRVQELLDQGADGFIPKPFTLESISEELNKILSKRNANG